jgi:transcriptional regulator with XRE-family HTH domain
MTQQPRNYGWRSGRQVAIVHHMTKRHRPPEQPPPANARMRQTGERLRAIRKLSGLRQTDICELLGVDQSTWSKWEIGQRFPDLGIMVAFAARMKVSLDLIYCGAPTGVHPILLKLLQAEWPHLLLQIPTDNPQDRDKALASYRAATLTDSSNPWDELCDAS